MAELSRQQLIALLTSIVGPDGVLHQPEELLVYEYDAYLELGRPDLVVLPDRPEQVGPIVALAARAELPVVARGAASGLSGGCVASEGGLVVDLNRLNALVEVRLDDRLALVEVGLVNADLSATLASDGFYYAPDPSSQRASTIGGNIAENAGGPHCLAQGMTTNHVVGLELVTGQGELVSLGGPAPDSPGYDLVGLVVGSEGTLGIVTRAWLRLLPLPAHTVTCLALFDRLESAGAAVSAVVARGVIPSALELIDGPTAWALEQAFQAGYPARTEGVLLIDLDGRPEDVAAQLEEVLAACRECGATGLRFADSADERARLWAARKGGLAALAHLAPNYYLHDLVVPRSRMAAVLREVQAIAEQERFVVATVAHAGDGNLHPTIMFDLREPGVLPRVIATGERILRVGVEAGGTISGEHGIGLEKQEYLRWIFSSDDLTVMRKVRAAFTPDDRFNPGKLLPRDQPRQARIKVWSSAVVSTETWI